MEICLQWKGGFLVFWSCCNSNEVHEYEDAAEDESKNNVNCGEHGCYQRNPMIFDELVFGTCERVANIL